MASDLVPCTVMEGERLDGWLRGYSTSCLKGFREDGKVVYDTIDNRRRRLGYTA